MTNSLPDRLSITDRTPQRAASSVTRKNSFSKHAVVGAAVLVGPEPGGAIGAEAAPGHAMYVRYPSGGTFLATKRSCPFSTAAGNPSWLAASFTALADPAQGTLTMSSRVQGSGL